MERSQLSYIKHAHSTDTRNEVSNMKTKRRKASFKRFLDIRDGLESENEISSISEEDTDKADATPKQEVSVTQNLITNFKQRDSLLEKLINIRREKEELEYVFNRKGSLDSFLCKSLTVYVN